MCPSRYYERHPGRHDALLTTAALLFALGLGVARKTSAEGFVAGLMTEWDVEYLWAGAPPRHTDRPGGWREYYFSSDVEGGALAVGHDANPCTEGAPCLSTEKMLSLAAPGVHFILDDGDDWNTSTTAAASFVLDQSAIGCPPNPDDVCVWFSTTAADPTLETVGWGKPSGAMRNCMNVSSDGTDRGWIFFDGFAVSCDAEGPAMDADGPDTNLRGKLWCENCPTVVADGDGADNAVTAHAGGITVISGVSPLVVADGAVGNNPVVATAGGGAVLILTRQAVSHQQTVPHVADVAFIGCGGVCSSDGLDYTPAVVLIGPQLECGAGCNDSSSLLELNPDRVGPLTPLATASALVAFTSFRHRTASGTHAIRPVASLANEEVWFRGYGNVYSTLDHVWCQTNGQLDPEALLDVEDMGFVATEPAGGSGADGAVINFADPDWTSAPVHFRLASYLYDNEDGDGEVDAQCYLENAAADVLETTMGACQDAIAAAGPRGSWSVDEDAVLAGSEAPVGEPFAQDLPNGIVLPDFVTGSKIHGVYFGGRIPAAIDVAPGSDPNRIDLRLYDGWIEVALLASEGFDAADVDLTTLGFGPGRAAPVDAAGPSLEDANADGLPDLVSHYRTGATGIALGDDEACLAGKQSDGLSFRGCDVISVVYGVPPSGCGLGPELAFALLPILWLGRRRRAACDPRAIPQPPYACPAIATRASASFASARARSGSSCTFCEPV